jgi:hypothetical protein
MKETFFILAVVAILVGLTAIRYRKQITAMIALYRQLQGVRERINTSPRDISDRSSNVGIQLIKCARCAKWIPQSEARGDVSSPVCAAGCEIAKPI